MDEGEEKSDEKQTWERHPFTTMMREALKAEQAKALAELLSAAKGSADAGVRSAFVKYYEKTEAFVRFGGKKP